jgi:hypothetical protein
MNRPDKLKLLLLVSIVLLGVSLSVANTRKMQCITAGMWGGLHVVIRVTDDSATIEYDCAHGTINGPLTVDSQGRFALSGTHVREHGGPIRMNEKEVSHPAIYTGSIDGEKMTLTVKLTDSDEPLGTFTLTHGQPGRLRKCR